MQILRQKIKVFMTKEEYLLRTKEYLSGMRSRLKEKLEIREELLKDSGDKSISTIELLNKVNDSILESENKIKETLKENPELLLIN